MKNILYKPGKPLEVRHKIKDSKFYGNIRGISSREDARQFINDVREKYADASHNVYGYILDNGEKTRKYFDDDGEPAGSSGPPVIQAIEGADLNNTVIVITRYFGGTKLGIGGLIRAYGDTARLAITEAGKKRLELYYYLSITGNYDIIGTIMGQIEAHKGEIVNTSYHNQGGTIEIKLHNSNLELLKMNLIEKTGNKVDIDIINKSFS